MLGSKVYIILRPGSFICLVVLKQSVEFICVCRVAEKRQFRTQLSATKALDSKKVAGEDAREQKLVKQDTWEHCQDDDSEVDCFLPCVCGPEHPSIVVCTNCNRQRRSLNQGVQIRKLQNAF